MLSLVWIRLHAFSLLYFKWLVCKAAFCRRKSLSFTVMINGLIVEISYRSIQYWWVYVIRLHIHVFLFAPVTRLANLPIAILKNGWIFEIILACWYTHYIWLRLFVHLRLFINFISLLILILIIYFMKISIIIFKYCPFIAEIIKALTFRVWIRLLILVHEILWLQVFFGSSLRSYFWALKIRLFLLD